jgi:sugar phosphate isomerase/epimerase/ADP-ribose pyrophosphatase YjhB (NUDIX family)
MKFSIAISTATARFQAISMRGDFQEIIRKVKEFGYDGVELAIRNPEELDRDLISRLIKNHNLEVSAIGTGQAYGEEGLSLTDKRKEIRRKAIKRLKEHVKFAQEFSAYLIIGLIRGKYENSLEKEKALNYLKDSLFEISDFAKNHNVKIVLEPINRYETNLLNNLEEVKNFIEKLNSDNIGILFDTFHSNIEEVSIEESIEKFKKYIWHIHFADSNRYSPGMGHIDFAKILNKLKEIKYSEFISLEILPYPAPEESARYGIEYLKNLLKKKSKIKYKIPSLTVDIIIKYPDNSIILVKRKNPPFQGMLALPGGFVEYGEKVEEAALREAEEETGLKVKLEKILGVYSDPKRDPRGHTVSIVYIAVPRGGDLKAGDDAKEIVRTKNIKFSSLAFDHAQIIRDFQRKIKY